VAALCLALAVPIGVATPAVAHAAHGLGRPALPKERSDATEAVTGPGAAKERQQVAKAKAANTAQAKAARAQQKAVWPSAGRASGALPVKGALRLTAGGMPVTVTSAAKGGAAGRVDVRALDQKHAQDVGVEGVLLSASADRAGSARLAVDYAKFASAYGGGWAGRLRLVELPGCALTTPSKAECRTQTPVATSNDATAQTLSATVAVPQAASPLVLAVAADAGAGEAPTGGGDYAATSLAPSSTWAAGGSSGSFTWSYPMATPPAATGPQPALTLSYDSGSIDGRTATTNNQGSQVGEGFDLSAQSYVERSYTSCDDDGVDKKYDLCWKYDNASLVLNGQSSQLVKDTATGQWRLKDDDASTVTHSTGADNGDEGDASVDGAGEYWTVTTGDGTKYVFGLDKLPGADTQRTNSVWTVPVYGNNSGEPGYADGSTLADRSKVQAWRWNLDYVVDLHGNAMSYWYTPETNYYAQNGATTGKTPYTRGGYLDHILYGQRSDTMFTGQASDKVQFTYGERCTASDCSSLTKDTAPKWPDVPFDAICAKDATCHATSPEFFTRKRLTKVETFAWNAAASPAAFAPVDAWGLAQEYLDPGDIGNSTDQSLVLDSVTHTGEAGGTAAMPPVAFTYQMRPNRVDGAEDDVLPLNRPRIQTITSETGAITAVTLSDPECVRGQNTPAEDDDTTSCYPVYWHVNGADEATLDWFNKYRVLDVVTSDPTGHGETMDTSYSYSGPAWHHNDDPMTPTKERTWSDWRGYRTVTTLTGSAAGTQSKNTTVYLQGMDGDAKKDGTTKSASVQGVSFTGLSVPAQTDSDQYAGFVREQITYDGSTPVTASVRTPWSKNTAGQKDVTPHAYAYYVRTGSTATSTYLTASGGWRTRGSSTSYDDDGMAVSVDDAGDTAKSGDETCTRTWYARNAALGVTSLVSRTRVTAKPCSTAETALNLPATATTRGDVLSDNATVYDNTSATAWTSSQTPTLGEATWTGRASAYPATATNGERPPTSWQTLDTTKYDDATAKLGRAVSTTDAAGNTTATAYVPAAAGPVTRVQVTNAKSQITYTYMDFARGSPVKEYDANNKITESAYDPLGRVTAVWLPSDSRAGGYGATYTYTYHVSNSDPSWTSSSSIIAEGQYTTTYSIFDALLRPLQTQSPSPNGGRVLTDTRYDSRGLAYETYADVHDSANAPSGQYQRAEYGRAPKQTDLVYDGAGRATSSTFLKYGVQQWSTATTYTGDSTATSAADGGSATRTITDALGRTTEQRTYAGTSPADAQYGSGTGAAYTSTAHTYTGDGKPLTVTGPDGAKWSYGYDLFGRQTSSVDPDKGTSTTGYTSLDQVDTTKDANGSTLLYGYDPLGRKTDVWKTARTDPDKLDHFAYDALAKGQLDSSTSYVGGTTGSAYTEKVTAYDSLYQPTTSELDLPAGDPLVTSGAVSSALTTQTYFNKDGTQQYVDDPAAGGLASEHVTTHYNALGLPTDMAGATGYLLGAAYTDTGLPQQLTLGTSAAQGTPKAYITDVYDEGSDELTQSTVTDQTHPYELQELNYGYDASGNVSHIFDPTTQGGTSAADDQCFTYDGYRRLTEAWTPSTADCATTGRTTADLGGASPYWTSYTYTSGGLRSTETDHSASGDSTATYCYDAARAHALTAVLTTAGANCTGAADTYGYDNAGDTTARPNGTDTQSLTWTPQDQLDTLTEKSSTGSTKSTTSHVYDADGNLLIKRDTGGDTVLYLGDTEVHLKTGTNSYWAQRYYSAGGTTIALRSDQTGTDTLTWLAGDPHGTATVAIDAATQKTTKRYTTVFGATRGGGIGTWPDDNGFLGKPTDADSGLTYVGAREYDPVTGRFLSVDPILDPGDPQSLNGYTYGDDNPLVGYDPTGTDNWWADPTMNKPVHKGDKPISQKLANDQGFGDLCNKNNCSGYNPKAKPSYLNHAAASVLAAAAGYGSDKHIRAISGKNTVSGVIAAEDEKWETQQYLDASRQVRAAVIARLQELVEAGELSPNQMKRFATISVAWDEKKKMIYWAAYKAGRKGSGDVCAEDVCDEEAARNGSAKEDLQYTETHGARNDEEVDICTRCQQSRDLEQFEASGAKMREGGRLYLQQMAKSTGVGDGEAEAEAEAEAMAQAEAEAEALSEGLAMGFEDE
jgi:RHS repeat-associated protein